MPQYSLIKDSLCPNEHNLIIAFEDAFEGYKDWKFDCIHVGAAAPFLPAKLVEALKPGGRMMIPIGPMLGCQDLYIVDKDMSGNVHKTKCFGVSYVPLVEGKFSTRTV